ncbi:hypothetical protein ABC855_g1947 [[Candida] zeylanoides]|jgi:hypothetical protein
MSKIPLHVRATDIFHRLTVLSLVGFSAAVIASAGYNVYMNSDYAAMNRDKLRFNKKEAEELERAHRESRA